ncbi:MAG: zinc ABC transporter substrate-binding protein [Gammaproteobacteria bacterium]
MKKTVTPKTLQLLCALLVWQITMASSLVRATESRESWPQVVVSSPPLHSLVVAIMGGQGDPQLLFRQQLGHHHAALRPSQLKWLDSADLLIWSGPQLEQPIETLINKGVIESRHWQAMECPGLRLLSQSGTATSHDHGHETMGNHHEEERDHPLNSDPHFWLDIDNAACLVRELTSLLAEIDPAHVQHYRQNSHQVLQRLTALDQKLAQTFAADSRPLMAYHNSFRYLLGRYRLQVAAELNPPHGQPPGLRQLLQFGQQLQSINPACVIADISAPRDQLQEWLAETDATLLLLDPMGGDRPAGEELYFQLLENLSEQIMACASIRASGLSASE